MRAFNSADRETFARQGYLLVRGGIPAARIDAMAAVIDGIVDTESYRKLGQNQLRIGLWPSIPSSDVEAFTACLDYVIEATLS